MIKRNDGISKDDICQNQFTAYVVLAVKRKRQSYIKKKQRDLIFTNFSEKVEVGFQPILGRSATPKSIFSASR